MSNQFACWKCEQALVDVILPMSRREECTNCSADQHVCKMCVFFIKARCDEERAEQVSDTERANFCDYFKPALNNKQNQSATNSASAKAQLAELFGDPIPKEDTTEQELSPAELAEKKLRELLNG